MREIDDQYLMTVTLRDSGEQRQVYYQNDHVYETVFAGEFINSAGMTLPEDQQSMSLSTFGKMAADVPAGLAKGAIQGTVGLPGDIESLVYGVRELMKRGAGESALDAFIRGLETETVAPKTEDVKKWIDTNIGPLVPAGETDEARKKAAGVSEFVGELGGAGKTVTEVTKGVVKAGKNLSSTAAKQLKKQKDKRVRYDESGRREQ